MFYNYMIVLFITLIPVFLIQISEIEQKHIYTLFLIFTAAFGIFINFYKQHPKVKKFLKDFF